MQSMASQKFSFDNIDVDPGANLIRVQGKEKRLEPKLVALLVFMARAGREVVSRQQLSDAIWPNVVVGEESVTQAIFSLRNALGDNAKQPKYIETIPKKGYRFLAEVSIPIAEETKQAGYRPWGWWSLVAIVAIAVGFGVWFPVPSYDVTRVVPMTKMPGIECCMALNGSDQMAFINQPEKAPANDIYLKNLVSGIQERVTQDEWVKGQLRWLDDQTLIYSRCQGINPPHCEIVRQPMHHEPQVIYRIDQALEGISLDPVTHQLLINLYGDNHTERQMLDLHTGIAQPWGEAYNLPQYLLQPTLTADRQLIFIDISARPKLMTLDLATGQQQLINAAFDLITGYEWQPSHMLLVTGNFQGTTGLWRIKSPESKPELLLRAYDNTQFFAPSRDSRHKTIYYQSAQFNRHLGLLANNGSPNSLAGIESSGTDAAGRLSDDGQRLYFVSDRTGFYELWRYDVELKQVSPITHLQNEDEFHNILPSHNEQRICAKFTHNAQVFLGVFSAITGELLVSLPAHAIPLSWSLDDRYIYAADYQNPIPQLKRYDSQTLGNTVIQKNAGILAQETASDVIRYIDLANNELVERNLQDGTTRHLLGLYGLGDQHSWSSRVRLDKTMNSLLVIKQDSGVHELWQASVFTAEGKPQKRMDLPSAVWITDISPDGSQVIYEQQAEPMGDIMKVEWN